MAVAHEVAHAPGVGAQHVVHLRPGQRRHLAGARRLAARAGHRLHAGLGQVVGVGGEQERRVGHVLHVVPLPDEEHAAGRAVDVAGVAVLVEAGAEVVLRLGLVLLQRRLVLRVLPFQQHLK